MDRIKSFRPEPMIDRRPGLRSLCKGDQQALTISGETRDESTASPEVREILERRIAELAAREEANAADFRRRFSRSLHHNRDYEGSIFAEGEQFFLAPQPGVTPVGTRSQLQDAETIVSFAGATPPAHIGRGDFVYAAYVPGRLWIGDDSDQTQEC